MEPTTSLSGTELAPGYLDMLLEECGENDGRLLVAVLEGVAVGYICFWDENLEFYKIKSQLRVSDVYVDPKYRGKGFGKLLLAEAERECRQRGHTRLILNVLAKNTSARVMYERYGFRDYDVVLVKDME
jgi:GNAT superfamily N-acetyltransferase